MIYDYDIRSDQIIYWFAAKANDHTAKNQDILPDFSFLLHNECEQLKGPAAGEKSLPLAGQNTVALSMIGDGRWLQLPSG